VDCFDGNKESDDRNNDQQQHSTTAIRTAINSSNQQWPSVLGVIIVSSSILIGVLLFTHEALKSSRSIAQTQQLRSTCNVLIGDLDLGSDPQPRLGWSSPT
jgi:hypothetical protein